MIKNFTLRITQTGDTTTNENDYSDVYTYLNLEGVTVSENITNNIINFSRSYRSLKKKDKTHVDLFIN